MKKFILINISVIVSIVACIALYQILEPKELEPNEKLNALLRGDGCSNSATSLNI